MESLAVDSKAAEIYTAKIEIEILADPTVKHSVSNNAAWLSGKSVKEGSF